MSNIAIDLGTATVMIYVEGRGIVLSEPSVAAYDAKTGELFSAGKEAAGMMGRAPESIVVVRPMMDGVISDYSVTEQMLRYFLSKVRRHNIFKPQVMACVPSVITSVDQRTIVEVIHRTGAKRVCLIEEPVAAAIGAGIDVSKPHGCMVVDIGGGTTDIAVISMGASVIKKSIKVAGASFDEAIARFVRREYSVTIGRLTAEDIKIRVGCTFPQKTVDTMVAKGVNFVTGYPEEFEINSKQVFLSLQEPLTAIMDAVQDVLEQTPPELIADIMHDGILMTGGGSKLSGLDKLIEWKTGVATRVADDAEYCVVLGTGKALAHIKEYPDGDREDLSADDAY